MVWCLVLEVLFEVWEVYVVFDEKNKNVCICFV